MKPPARSEPRRPGEPIDRLSLIRNQPLFSHLGPAAIAQLASRMTRKAVKRGTVIFRKDDPGSGLVGVIRGSVKISVVSGDGREAVLSIINPGEVFGEMALLDGEPRSASATAMTDCELVFIDRGAFVTILRADPDVAIKIIEILCARLRRSSERMQDVMHLDGPARLAKIILQLAGGDGAEQRRVKITQLEISEMVGLSREMTNKLLRRWQRSRWLRLERGGLVLLQPEPLEKIASAAIETG